MDYQELRIILMKINKDKRIGNVLFIVEGSKTEFIILRKIFCNLLSYTYIEKRRNKLHSFYKTNDIYSKIAVINTRESNISDITLGQEYLDEVFKYLIEECQFPVDDCAIYYLFDRDPKSNTDSELILNYIKELTNPYENENLKAGQLLLSYPAFESFLISCFIDNSFKINDILDEEKKIHIGSELKTFIGTKKEIQTNKINDNSLIHATNDFIQFLTSNQIDFDIDDFSSASENIFYMQEEKFKNQQYYALFSMITLAFLQLGIIEI